MYYDNLKVTIKLVCIFLVFLTFTAAYMEAKSWDEISRCINDPIWPRKRQ